MEISISAIEVPPRLRPMNQERVDAIKVSIAQLGLLNAVTVFSHGDGTFMLAAGAHRLQATRQLGWDSIEANVMNGSDIDRQLIEIDENLCRSDLGPADRARHAAKRKALWLSKRALEQQRVDAAADSTFDDGEGAELGGSTCAAQQIGDAQEPANPTVRTGDVDARGQRRSLQQRPGFAASTAAISGGSKVEVNRNVRRGEALGEVLCNIAGTSLDKGVELDALVRLSPEERIELASRAKAGEAVSARSAVAVKAGPARDVNASLAKRAIAALEKCAVVMNPHEFGDALRSTVVSERAILLVHILLTR